MSLKHRNGFAWILILLSAALWVYGRSAPEMQAPDETGTGWTSVWMETDAVTAEETQAAEIQDILETQITDETEAETGYAGFPAEDFSSHSQTIRTLSCIASLMMAAASVFLLYAKSPLLGPDLAVLVPGALLFLSRNFLVFSAVITDFLSVAAALLLLRGL